MEESNRQKKIGGLLQEDLANILLSLLRENGHANIIVSVSKVSVTVDLSIAKVYVSVFPANKGAAITKELNLLGQNIKHKMAMLTKNQLRKMPDLFFYNDDSLEYIEQLEKALKGTQNPIKDPSLLHKRKKI